jgi:hypothetical protein
MLQALERRLYIMAGKFDRLYRIPVLLVRRME